MIEHIPDLLEAGVDSLKIEGRMKTALYVAAVTRTYRRAIDDYKTSPDLFEKNLDYYREEIAKMHLSSVYNWFLLRKDR